MSKFFGVLRAILNSTAGRGFTSCVMLFSSFLSILSAFPTVESYVRLGRTSALSSLLFGTAIALIWGGSQGAFAYIAIVAVATIFVGETVNREYPVPRIVMYSGLFTMILFLFLGIYIKLYYVMGPLDYLASKLDAVLTMTATTYPDLLKNTLMDTGMTQKELASFLAVKLPAIVSSGMVIFLFINLLFAARFNYRTNAFFRKDNLSKFKLSDFLVIPALVFAALYIYSISGYNDSKLLEAVAGMILATVASVYFLEGLLIVSLFVKGFLANGFWSTIVIILLAVTGYTVIAGVGFFDTWFDFRKYFLNKDKKGE